ncbi:CHASE2 domain-containing protein [Noviherbaspirillum sp. ST9]|uniref:CHASE2 domain-containing protein n=1 Tax=Noviherbaspirillum sp. ST9 TaxID=3401606 RepID=UPI003B5873BD
MILRLGLGLLAWVVLGVLALTPWWERIEENNFDWLTIMTSPGTADSPITIVGIDEPSFAEFQRQWPWPRSMHGALIDRLKEEGAKVIALDVLFLEPSTPQADTALADAIRRAGNVVLAAEWEQRSDGYIDQQREILPLRSLLDAGAATGVAKVPLSGACIRRFPAFDNAFGRAVLDTAGIHVDPAQLPRQPMIRYAGPAKSFSYVSYYQALNPKEFLPRGFFKDRIVLVGMVLDNASQLGIDLYCTPYAWQNRRFMPGVEINANVIDAAMHKRVIAELDPMLKLALLALLALASFCAFRRWSPARAGLLLALLAGGTAGASWALFAFANRWWPVFAPLAGIFVTWLGSGAAAFLEERRKRAEVRRAFGHYVSPAVIEQMLAQPERLRLGGERREVTLLFSDLAGFTSISEKLDPEEVAEIMNFYLTEMGAIVIGQNGTLDKFIGDAVMAFWNAPLDDPDHALHACEAALKMQQAMRAVNDALRRKGMAELSMRIGVHTGMAVVGNMGSTERFDYTAIGDSVNLAARLEGANKVYGTGILVSGATADALRGRLPLRHMDRVRLKGKSEAVEVYTLEEAPEGNDAAIAAWRTRAWDESERLWRKVLEANPSDSLASLYLERIEGGRGQAPEEDWDGAFTLDAK